jgi:enoyl-[acyl-carrier protein] reductase I
MADLLKGQLCLILGVANKWSLAYAIAEAFSREGAGLVLTYLGEQQRSSVESLCQNLNVVKLLACDVTKDDEITQMGVDLGALGRPLNTVVHSLAFANREDLSRPFVETQRDGFLLAQNVSAYSLVAVTRAVVPLMTEGGSILTMTYLGSTRVVQNYNVMGVAKAALEASVRYLANDLGPSKIRVNAISAGAVKTASARAIKDFPMLLSAMTDRSPFQRNTEPAEVADAAVFLASSLGRGVTGNVLFVDSGMHIIGI